MELVLQGALVKRHKVGGVDDPRVAFLQFQEDQISVLQEVVKVMKPVAAPLVLLDEIDGPSPDMSFPLW